MLRSAQGIVVDAAMLTDAGRDPEKQVNEDAVALTETDFGIAAIVCDGMGGHDKGELASHVAIQGVLQVLCGEDQPPERLLSAALERAHAEVYALGGSAPAEARPGSTSVILALAGREGFVAHVGDSRAYRIRARQVERLTRDHSVVEALLAAGAITPEHADHHPDANRITRALGIAAEIDPEVSAPIPVEAGDTFVLCSDGLSDLVGEPEIGEIVSAESTPESACHSLVQLANERGGYDNISVQVLRVLALGPYRSAGRTLEATPQKPVPSDADDPNPTRNTTPSPPLDAEQPTLADDASELYLPFESSKARNGGTVAMGTGDGIPQTVRQTADPAPTVLDPRARRPATPQTLSDDTHWSPRISRAADPRSHGLKVHALFWLTVGACGLILVTIFLWWLIR